MCMLSIIYVIVIIYYCYMIVVIVLRWLGQLLMLIVFHEEFTIYT